MSKNIQGKSPQVVNVNRNRVSKIKKIRNGSSPCKGEDVQALDNESKVVTKRGRVVRRPERFS